jgi:FAD/FMN-containing dehydrogenase
MAGIQGFRGRQLRRGDEGYDAARTLYNAMIDRRPALIAQCEDAGDVARAIAHARRRGLPLAVKAGGHSVAGACLNDGGVVVDVSPLKEIAVDRSRRVARVGAGVLWGELDRATQEHGLATTGGRVSTTGVAGFTLGGGSGWLERSYGLSCDNLIAVELVTAAGEHVRATATENADLFWALHGGGGNFGVATAFEFRLHEVGPEVFSGLALYDPRDARELARAVRDFHENGPVEAGVAFGHAPARAEYDFLPAEWRDRVVFFLAGMWNGAPGEGERALRPLIEAAEPIADLFGTYPYVEFQRMIDDPPGFRNWWTAEYLHELADEAIDALCAYSEQIPSGYSQMFVVAWGGAVASPEPGPLAGRDAAYVVHPFCMWKERARDAEHIAWGKRVREVCAPWATGATYLNFIGDEGGERVRAAFGQAYERLVQVKTAWDPDNVFSGNQNIEPAAAPVARRRVVRGGATLAGSPSRRA